MRAYDVTLLVRDPVSSFPREVVERVEAGTRNAAGKRAAREWWRRCAPVRVVEIRSVVKAGG